MSTPARSRVSGAAGTRSSSSHRNARRSSTDLGGAQAVAVDLPGRCCPCSSWIGTRGSKPKFLQDFSEGERRAYVEANAAALRALLPADLVFTEPRADGRARRSGQRRPLRVKAHGSELENLERGRPELGEWRGKLFARGRDVRWVEHIREVLADVVGHTTTCSCSSRRGH